MGWGIASGINHVVLDCLGEAVSDIPLMARADLPDEINGLTGKLVSIFLEIHRTLGPGFKETHCQEAITIELAERAIAYEEQRCVVVPYKGRALHRPFRVDLIVDDKVLVEVKAIDLLTVRDRAQVVGYLRATGLTVGLLVNFHAARVMDQVVRVVSRPNPPPI